MGVTRPSAPVARLQLWLASVVLVVVIVESVPRRHVM
jgi:hypothetical protein